MSACTYRVSRDSDGEPEKIRTCRVSSDSGLYDCECGDAPPECERCGHAEDSHGGKYGCEAGVQFTDYSVSAAGIEADADCGCPEFVTYEDNLMPEPPSPLRDTEGNLLCPGCQQPYVSMEGEPCADCEAA